MEATIKSIPSNKREIHVTFEFTCTLEELEALKRSNNTSAWPYPQFKGLVSDIVDHFNKSITIND